MTASTGALLGRAAPHSGGAAVPLREGAGAGTDAAARPSALAPHHAAAMSMSAPATGRITCGAPRAAMNSGRGFSTPKGAASRLLTAL